MPQLSADLWLYLLRRLLLQLRDSPSAALRCYGALEPSYPRWGYAGLFFDGGDTYRPQSRAKRILSATHRHLME